MNYYDALSNEYEDYPFNNEFWPEDEEIDPEEWDDDIDWGDEE